MPASSANVRSSARLLNRMLGKRDPVVESEHSVAAGSCRGLPGVTAAVTQVCFSLGVARDARLLDQLGPLSGREPGQGGLLQAGAVRTAGALRGGGAVLAVAGGLR
jgi:hypothetical protein